MKIMIIEDEQNIRQDLRLLLQSASYEVTVPEGFDRIPEEVALASPDLILLDIHLPGKNGWEVCQAIRQNHDVPVIFVTSDDQTASEINGMLLGADDYITKPYHPSLLLARVAAVLKRCGRQQPEFLLEHKGVTLDLRTYQLRFGVKQEELTKNECRLLGYLLEHKGQVVPRMELLDHLWDHDIYIDDSALTVNVTRIRKKLEAVGAGDFIETKRGVGYRI
jgi:DNA-binding response OmpR family regulator